MYRKTIANITYDIDKIVFQRDSLSDLKLQFCENSKPKRSEQKTLTATEENLNTLVTAAEKNFQTLIKNTSSKKTIQTLEGRKCLLDYEIVPKLSELVKEYTSNNKTIALKDIIIHTTANLASKLFYSL